MPVLGSPGSEWLWWLAIFLAYWQCLSLTLQSVSGCGGLLCFQPTDNACPWLFREWVAVVPCCVSILLTLLVLDSSGSEWLWWLAVFLAFWQHLFLALQSVSIYGGLLFFLSVDNTCLWLFRKWVAVVDCCVSSLLTMPVLGSSEGVWLWWFTVFSACWQCMSLALQKVSGCCALLLFWSADNACPWLSRKWVAWLCSHFWPVDNVPP